ncbi:Retrovirus-related Pol polyprotein from transposon RE1 [Linum perenne]
MAAPSLLSNATATVTSSPSLVNLQVPPVTIKLGRDNFALWRSTILATLEAYNLESFILSPTPPPATRLIATTDGESTPKVNPAYTDWKKQDRFVLLWLRSTLSDHAMSLVVRSSTSQTAWLTIERSFHSKTRARRMQLKTQLLTLTKGVLSVSEYIHKMRAISDDLASNLHPVSEEDLIGYILNGLDSSYGPFKTAFMMKADSITTDDLEGLLLLEEAQLELDHSRHAPLLPTPPQSPHTAFQADRSSGRSYAPRHNSRKSLAMGSSPARSYGQRSRLTCQLCRSTGHEAIDCWQRANQADYPSRRPPPQGHEAIDSWQRATQADYPSRRPPPQGRGASSHTRQQP